MPLSLLENISLAEKTRILDHLLTFVSANKQQKFREKITCRTRHITVVLEDIFQPHNASAVLRSCDCFGIQDVHIIENKNKYDVNPDVALGASKWLNLNTYNTSPNNTAGCLSTLRENGYILAATSPHVNDFSPETMPLDRPVALLFGTEMNGLSEEASSMADVHIRIPMVGFTESLNISVSAAILLYTLSSRLRQSEIEWSLSSGEKTMTMLQWATAVIKKPDLIIRDLINQ